MRGYRDTPKSEKSERTFAIGRLASELFDHRARTRFRGDDERVFCNPLTGGPLDPKRYAVTLRLALKRAKIDKPMRPFHDGRHTSITNAAAAGVSPAALMARAGHSDFKTTQGYIDLAGETFREEADLADERLFGKVTREGPRWLVHGCAARGCRAITRSARTSPAASFLERIELWLSGGCRRPRLRPAGVPTRGSKLIGEAATRYVGHLTQAARAA